MGGQVVLVEGPNPDPLTEKQLQLSAQFYGLELKTLRLVSEVGASQALESLRSKDTIAAVLSADALPKFSQRDLVSSLRRSNDAGIALLIADITAQTDMRQLESWSDGVLSGCRSLGATSSHGTYAVGPAADMAAELAGQEIPSSTLPKCSFAFHLASDPGNASETLISFRDSGDEPFFIRHKSDSEEKFFLAALQKPDLSAIPARNRLPETFTQLLPMMMFLRHAGGERIWHSDGHYANLTIDDAWLTEPYGNLDYQRLLGEMEAHNFHTTIAFIPWNFDRSESSVVRLFASNPQRYSIAIHGDNHTGEEFGSYRQSPLSGQVAAMKQALARMARFQNMTALPYDRVMIPPQEIPPPLQTLRELQRYNFIAAADAVNTPLGSPVPSDPLFLLRAVTSDFPGVPVVRRYSAEAGISKVFIAINAFLGNPLLFYGHQGMFTDGINAFDPVADAVNQLQPGTRWASLGEIAQHLYLVRLRDDSDYDVRTYSSDFILVNEQKHPVVFHIEKKEDSRIPIASVTVDGKPRTYELSGGVLRTTIPADAGASRHVVIEYENDFSLASVDISKRNPIIALRRWASDFRDLTLSGNTAGRAITRVYYGHHLDEIEIVIERSFWMLLFGTLVVITMFWLFRKRAKGRKLDTF